MAQNIEKREEFVLTRKQFETRRDLGQLIVGATYHITDDPTPQDIIYGYKAAKRAEQDLDGNDIISTYRRKDDSYSAKETQDKLDTKVDIIKDKIGLYLQQADGTVTIKQMASGEAKAWTVAERSTNGTLYVGTPTENSHATTKQYVDVANTTLQANINTVDKKLETPVLKDFAINHNADNISITNTYVNLNTAAETNDTKNINLVSESTAGLMSTGDYKTLRDLSARVGNLEGKTTRLLYTEKTDPTADDIQTFVDSLKNDLSESEYTAPYEGLTVVIDEVFHIWRYYENDNIGWRDDGVDSVHQFTNETKGIILGSTQDGKIYAETDGTGSVNGWSNLVNNVETNARNIEQNTQDISTNAGDIKSINGRTINGHTFNQDVTLNMTDIEDNENYVKFTNLAVNNGDAGIVSIGTGGTGITINKNGKLQSVSATTEEIESESEDTYRNLQPRHVSKIVHKGLTSNTLTWSETEKQAARDLLGAVSINDVDTSIANIKKEVQNISSLETIYNDFADLPILDAAKNGTRYVTKTNGALPLKIYDWWNDTQEWKLVDQIRGSTIYIDLNTGLTYIYRSISPYLFPTSYTKTSQLENDVPFATEQYVDENGGKIDTVSVNGTKLTIDENKNVDITIPVTDVKVNGTSIVSNKNANISIGSVSFSGTSQSTSGSSFTSDLILHSIAKTGKYSDLLEAPNIVDNLNSESTKDVLSANQGRQLKSLIQGLALGKSYSSIEDLITTLNSYNKTELTVGTSLYILQREVPDFWVTEVLSSSTTFSYTNDDDFLNLFKSSATVQVGYYKIAINETSKVDLTDYATKVYVESLYDGLNTRLTTAENSLANKVDKTSTGTVEHTVYSKADPDNIIYRDSNTYTTSFKSITVDQIVGEDADFESSISAKNLGLFITSEDTNSSNLLDVYTSDSLIDPDSTYDGALIGTNLNIATMQSIIGSGDSLRSYTARTSNDRAELCVINKGLEYNTYIAALDSQINLYTNTSSGSHSITIDSTGAKYNGVNIATVDMIGESSSMTIREWTE